MRDTAREADKRINLHHIYIHTGCNLEDQSREKDDREGVINIKSGNAVLSSGLEVDDMTDVYIHSYINTPKHIRVCKNTDTEYIHVYIHRHKYIGNTDTHIYMDRS